MQAKSSIMMAVTGVVLLLPSIETESQPEQWRNTTSMISTALPPMNHLMSLETHGKQ